MDANRRPIALLIDNEAVSSRVQKARLEGRGYTVFVAPDVAANGAEAVSRVRRMAPNMIFVHLASAAVGNLPLLQALRSDDVCRHVPVVVIRDLGDERTGSAKLKAVPRNNW